MCVLYSFTYAMSGRWMCSCRGDLYALNALGTTAEFCASCVFFLLFFPDGINFDFVWLFWLFLCNICGFCGSPPWSLHGLIFPFCPHPLFLSPPDLPLPVSFPPFVFSLLPFAIMTNHTTLYLVSSFFLSFYSFALLSCLWQPPLHSLLQRQQRPLRAPAS